MESKQRINVFNKNQALDNLFIDVPLITESMPNTQSNWMQQLIDLSEDKKMNAACNVQSFKDFFSILIEKNILNLLKFENNKNKIVVCSPTYNSKEESMVQNTSFEIVLADSVVAVEVGAPAIVVAVGIGSEYMYSLRNEKYKAICKFADKNGGNKFGEKISKFFKKLETEQAFVL